MAYSWIALLVTVALLAVTAGAAEVKPDTSRGDQLLAAYFRAETGAVAAAAWRT